MLFVPSNMMTDHFDAPATKYTDFWIRGQSATLATLLYCMKNMEAEVAAKAMLGLSAGIAILYPFNAKFGYLSNLEVKCAPPVIVRVAARRFTHLTRVNSCVTDPMHYLPEALMLGMTVAGVLALK